MAKKKRRKPKKKKNIELKHTIQRDMSQYRINDSLLEVSKKRFFDIKKTLDKKRANDYRRDRDVPRETLRHDLRRVTKKPYLKKRSLRYGPQDKIARVYLLNKTKEGENYKRSPRLGFERPKEQEVCRRRSKRREMLFKLGHAGKGASIRTKKHYNDNSKVRCK
jgi:hypothetical protein